jgi:hypothetical protein
VNPEFRKVALIAAGLGLLVSLFFALRPDDDDEPTPTTTAVQTTAATSGPEVATTETTTTAPPKLTVVRITVTVKGGEAPAVKRLTVKQDRHVVFVVKSEIPDEVHLHGYDLSADVAPGKPATIRFTATATGIFEVELETRRLPIAELEVLP